MVATVGWEFSVRSHSGYPEALFNQRLHARIGWMMYHRAMVHSAIP